MVKEHFMTPLEVLENNPKMRKFWDARQIGYLLYLELVDGTKLPRGCLVSERQVVGIFDRYILGNVGVVADKERFKTPLDVWSDNPVIAVKWDPRKIGYLFYLKLVDGKKLQRGCLVSEPQVVEIFDHYLLNIDN